MIFKTREIKIEQSGVPGEEYLISKIGNEWVIDTRNKSCISAQDIETFKEIFKFVEENIRK